MLHKDTVARQDMLFTNQGVNRDYDTIKVKRIAPNAQVPTQAHEHDAGWDLYSNGYYNVVPHNRVLVSTGICLEMPEGYRGLIWPRSGLAYRNGVMVLAGVIDAGYRDEIKIIIYNSDNEVLTVNPGDRIAQILFQKVPSVKLEVSKALSDSERGENGFGSTGV